MLPKRQEQLRKAKKIVVVELILFINAHFNYHHNQRTFVQYRVATIVVAAQPFKSGNFWSFPYHDKRHPSLKGNRISRRTGPSHTIVLSGWPATVMHVFHRIIPSQESPWLFYTFSLGILQNPPLAVNPHDRPFTPYLPSVALLATTDKIKCFICIVSLLYNQQKHCLRLTCLFSMVVANSGSAQTICHAHV